MAEVIVALDLPSPREALALVDDLPGLRWVKLGSALYVRHGPGLVRELRERDLRVFLDLKWHDIPNTVEGAVRGAAELGIALATVHALGGEPMLRAAVAASGVMRLAAVTVLTSHAPAEYFQAAGHTADGSLSAEVERLARLAVGAGVHGVVASPLEVGRVRRAIGPGAWIVVPGIRPAGAPAHDQRRTADPATAVKAGATHLVVGRPVTRAKNPRSVYEEICDIVRHGGGS